MGDEGWASGGTSPYQQLQAWGVGREGRHTSKPVSQQEECLLNRHSELVSLPQQEYQFHYCNQELE